MTEQANAARILAAASEPGRAPRPARRRGDPPVLLTGSDLLALPDPECIVDGLLPADGLMVLYGPSGTFKSFLALDIALSIASGLPFLGHRTRRGYVVYVSAEGRGGLPARYRAWMAERGVKDIARVRFITEAVNLLDDGAVRGLEAALRELPEPPALVVIDTLARCMVGGDENSAQDIGRFVAAVDRLRGDSAALVVHHTGKDAGPERGSSALRGAADLMGKVRRDGRGRNLSLSCEKWKDAPEWPEIPLAMEPVAGSLVVARRVEREQAADDLTCDVLAVIERDAPVSKNEIAKQVPKRKGDVLAAVDALEAAGKVIGTSKGYESVPAGPEPVGNREPGGLPAGGSERGGRPVGAPRREPPGPRNAIFGSDDEEPGVRR